MSPRSLLFSSDQETSRQIRHALQELQQNVAACTEIFAALKTLTSKSFDVLVIDWDEGLEASFLLKTARESRSNQNVFAIVVGRVEASAALEQAGADLVLSKPVQSSRAKHLLLNCDAFVRRFKVGAPQPPFASARFMDVDGPANVESRPRPTIVPGWPVPAAALPPAADEPPVHLSFATFQDGLAGDSFFNRSLAHGAKILSAFASSGPRGLMLRSAAIGVLFFAVGYVFSQPLSQVSDAVAKVGNRTWQSMRTEQQPVEVAQATAVPAQDLPSDTPPAHTRNKKIRVVPLRSSQLEGAPIVTETPAPVAQPAAFREPAAPEQQRANVDSSRQVNIPESLGSPFPGLTAAREMAAKVSPALMDALEPVTIPGSLSEKLLLQRIDPSYPERALRAGLRGPVVLQAWIGKDGRIQELKLIRGPLLLGQAAFDAVRNWRYKPYVRNGEAVEAQTLVTVDFKLP
jgi:protein TonB